MKVSGQDILSRETERSSKYLPFVASVVILIEIYDVPLEDLTILGVKAPAELFDVVALVITSYSMWNLLLHWLGDVAAWRMWFHDNNLQGFGESHSYREWIGQHLSHIETTCGKDMDLKKKLEVAQHSTDMVIKYLENCGTKF